MHNTISTKRRTLRLLLFILLSIWIFGFISLCLNITSLYAYYPFQKFIYGNVCHQNPSKSFNCNDVNILVCARCSGIYFGALLSALILILFNQSYNLQTKFLFLFPVPMLLDVVLLSFNFYDYNKLFSSFTGFLFGSAVFVYILNGIENLLFTEQKQ